MKVEQIVEGFFQVLGREPEESAKLFYKAKDLSYEDFCRILRNSPEYKRKMPSSFVYPETKILKHKNSYTDWPKPQLFVAENLKIVYCPIAKNACSSLKRLMVEVSNIDNKEEVLSGDIHVKTDDFNTGIQLKDLSEDHARNVLFDDSYLRFVVLRDPAARLLSAYWEKFVINRMTLANLNITTPVLKGVSTLNGGHISSPDRGITFREFVDYVSRTEFDVLDPHWKPQFKYVEDLTVTNFYNQSSLDPLYRMISDLCGYEVEKGKRNVSNSGKGEFVSEACDLLPGELLSFGGVSKDSFLVDELMEIIMEVYSRDYELMEMCVR